MDEDEITQEEIPHEESLPSQLWDRFTEFLRIFPVLILLVLAVYSLNSSAKQAIDNVILQTPAKDLVSGQYENYPAFLNEEDIVIRKTVFNDSGVLTEGLIIEIHNPSALAKTKTSSMQPMFGPGNLLVQEEVDKNTQLNEGDIVIYEDDQAKLIIHQIVGKNGDCFLTKGLNNPAPDVVCVKPEMIKFRLLFAIPTK